MASRKDGLGLQLPAQHDRPDRPGQAAGRVGGLRDRGRRPALQDQPQRRGDQRVRQHAGQGLRAAAATRTRASASSRRATSACRTTAARTACSTATSASQDLTPGSRRPPTRPGCSRSPATARTRSRSARSTRPATSRSASRSTFEIGGARRRRPDAAAVAAEPSTILPPMIDTPATFRLGTVLVRGHAGDVHQARPLGPGGLHRRDDRLGDADGLERGRQAAEAEPPHDRRRGRRVLGPAHRAQSRSSRPRRSPSASRRKGGPKQRQAHPVGADARLGQARHDDEEDDHASSLVELGAAGHVPAAHRR